VAWLNEVSDYSGYSLMTLKAYLVMAENTAGAGSQLKAGLSAASQLSGLQ
jgi:hypothetical protein